MMKGSFGAAFIDPFSIIKAKEPLSIDSLKNLSDKERKEKLKEIAAQFEAILVDTMLKTARETEKLFNDESEDTFGMNLDFYKEFSDYYFSRALVSQNGLGFQKFFIEEMEEKLKSIYKDTKTENVPPLKRSNLNKGLLELSLPVKGKITSGFGIRKDPFTGKKIFHRGIDIAAPEGTPVKAFMDGRVVFSGIKGGYGNLIIVQHRNGTQTYYGHLGVRNVKVGEKVRTGEKIGEVGSTGRSTGPHLHFELRVGRNPVNPENLIHDLTLNFQGKIPINKLENYIKGGTGWLR